MRKHEIRKTLLGMLLAFMGGFLSLVQAVPYNGCPDFMDINASYLDFYTGMTDNPFDSLGMNPNRHHLNEDQGYDPNTGNKLKFIPDGKTKSIRLGNDRIGGESEAIVYHYIVDPDNSLLFVNFAVVMEDPGHAFAFQPRFVIRITDKNGKLVNDCSVYDVTAAAGLDGFQDYAYVDGDEYHTVRWRDWSKIGLDLTPFIGQEVQVQFITYDCFLFGHYGYAYFTASCAPNKLNLDVCEGSSFSLAAPEGFPSYRWDNGDTSRVSTRTYRGGDMNIYCEITSATGCQFIQSAYVTDSYAGGDVTIRDTICQGEAYNLHNFDLPPQMNVGTFGFTNLVANPATCSATSTVSLELTVLQKYFPINVSICEGEDYTENGFHIIQPPVGVLTDTLKFERSKQRCDSIVCLRLVVNDTKNLANELKGELHPCTNQVVTYSSELEDNLSQYKWDLPANVKVVSGEHSPQIALYFTSDEPATLTLIGENGCGSSTVPYTVYPYPSYHKILSDTICQGESYSNGNITLGKQEKSGFFTSTHSFQTKKGCDSTIVLQLTVLPLPVVAFEVTPNKGIHCDSSMLRLSVKSTASTLIYHQCDPSPVSIGDVFCTDGSFVSIDSFPASGKQAEGVVYHYDDTEGYAYVVHLFEPSQNLRWSNVYYDIPALENQQYLPNLLEDMDGFGHTSLIRGTGDANEYPLAWSADLEHGWYIPAIGELRKMFGSVSLLNASLNLLGGDSIYYNNYDASLNDRFFYYFSSSEYNEDMACCLKWNFFIYAIPKSSYVTTRYSRKVKLSNWTQPKYKMGDLIVNEDGSKGIVLCVSPDGKSGTMIAMADDSARIQNTYVPLADPYMAQVDDRLVTSRGYECTRKYRELGDSTQYPAAWTVDFENGWYIPTRAEMNFLYANMMVMDSALYENGGISFSVDDYWTCDATTDPYGYTISIPQGNFNFYPLTEDLLFRPMRQFTVCEDYTEYEDTTLSYRWNTGDTVPTIVDYPTRTTNYEVTILSNEGKCNSKYDTTIYVQSVDPIVLNKTVCHGQVYKDDYFEASESGVYHAEADNGECTQKITLNLTVLDAQDTTYVSDVTCQGSTYKKNGFFLQPSSPGFAYDTITLSDGKGCDSVICLRLEVLPAQRDTQYAHVCQNEGYFKNGFEIPAFQPAGLQYKERSELNEEGCTLIHVLALTVDTVYQISMVDSICHMERYQRNGFDFVADEEGYSVHYQTLTSSTHCDSILSLSVKAFPRTDFTYSDTIMYGDTYRDQNFDLPAQRVSGLHTFDTMYVNSKGCDSLVTLLLFVRNEDDVDVPTSFTPKDGNGINDIFMEGYEIFIHDRYGLLVCHSTNGWDGSYRGEPADAGVYIYTIRFRNGKEKHGTVEILKE
ncbi:MAG: gliding motility-associated C-terminal domain-containing protein [Paludibacteraceae bacterium]|nr:gliding motility-associated C-terminal domain-containing protein [Paludibacteraceae bacterium]